MYYYQEQREKLFTERGFKILIEIRDKANQFLDKAGSFRAQECFIAADTGPISTCTMHTVLDYLVECGEIREVGNSSGLAQHAVYVRG